MSGTQNNALGEGQSNVDGLESPSVTVFGVGGGFFNGMPVFAYNPGTGHQIINPSTVAALQNSFVAQGTGGLAALTSIGAAEYSGASNLFSQWGGNLNTLSTTVANTEAEAVAKSASGGNGLFGQILGGIGALGMLLAL